MFSQTILARIQQLLHDHLSVRLEIAIRQPRTHTRAQTLTRTRTRSGISTRSRIRAGEELSQRTCCAEIERRGQEMVRARLTCEVDDRDRVVLFDEVEARRPRVSV